MTCLALRCLSVFQHLRVSSSPANLRPTALTSAGVVVGQYDRAAALYDGGLKALPWMNEAAVKRADADDFLAQDVVLGVQEEHAEVLLFLVSKWPAVLHNLYGRQRSSENVFF